MTIRPKGPSGRARRPWNPARNGRSPSPAIRGHFDGPQDQGRDRDVTRYLLPKGETLSKVLHQIDREEGLAEVRALLKGAMRGRFLNAVRDKHVWIKWMERRVHGELGARRAPTGFVPEYEDLKALFREVLQKPYTPDDYACQFTIRVPENLGKINRVEAFHRTQVEHAPEAIFEVLEAQRARLERARATFGDRVPPIGCRRCPRAGDPPRAA